MIKTRTGIRFPFTFRLVYYFFSMTATNLDTLLAVADLLTQWLKVKSFETVADGECWTIMFSDLFGEKEDLAKAFSSLTKKEVVRSWLHTDCAIKFNDQQGRAMRRELILTNRSRIEKRPVESHFSTVFLKTIRTASVKYCSQTTASPAAGTPSSPVPTPAIPATSVPCPSAASSVPAGRTPQPPATPVTPARAPATSSPVAPAPTVPAAAQAALRTPRLLSRMKRTPYQLLHTRQKQRVKAKLLSPIQKMIRQHVAVDGRYITTKAILTDLAHTDSSEERAAEQRREAKVLLAAHPIVQSQVQNYCAVGGDKQEKKRILSYISPDFTLKEINMLVFTPDMNVKVWKITHS